MHVPIPKKATQMNKALKNIFTVQSIGQQNFQLTGTNCSFLGAKTARERQTLVEVGTEKPLSSPADYCLCLADRATLLPLEKSARR